MSSRPMTFPVLNNSGWYEQNKNAFWIIFTVTIFIVCGLICIISLALSDPQRSVPTRFNYEFHTPNRNDERIDAEDAAQLEAKLKEVKDSLSPGSSLQLIELKLYLQAKADDVETVGWDDVVGQEKAKQALIESVVWPRSRPDIFKGPRAPPKGILLFGPPGTGKTMLAKAVASNLEAPFFVVSSANLTDSLFGESEKLVAAIFSVAGKIKKGAVIFIDEIDSMLSSRDNLHEHEVSRRMKTQFFTSLQGVQSKQDSNVLVIAATNRPYDLDSAALRRFSKRIRVDLPQVESIRLILSNAVRPVAHALVEEDFKYIAEAAILKNYNASDLSGVASFAAMEPIRRLKDEILTISPDDPRLQITRADFEKALASVQGSADASENDQLLVWEQHHGSL